MHLKSLELMGFKSFGHKTVFEFQPGITAIIGPNGSGKSNICDAVRWVLGEQSAKALRGNKMSEVIFAGSNQIRPSAFAQVKLVLDNESRRLPVDYSEVTIGRQLFRSGESNYIFNGQRTLLSEIRELLMDTGIGKEGYSVIGQGDIDDIIFQKTHSRRAIIEEAAGITKFKHRKANTLQKLENTRENITRLRDIIAEIENQLGPLAQQAEKARKYQALQSEIRSLEIDLLLFDLNKLYEENENIDSLRRGLQSKIQELQNFLSEISSKKGRLKEELQILQANLETEQQKVKETNRAIEEARTHCGTMKEELSSYIARQNAIREEIASIVEHVSQNHDEICQAENLLKNEEAVEIEILEKIHEIETNIKKTQNELEEYLREVAQDRESSFNVAFQIAEKKNRIASNNQQIQMLKRQVEKGKQEANSVQAQLLKLETEKSKVETEICELQKQIAENESVLGADRAKLQKLEKELEKNQIELSSVADQIKLFTAKRNILEDLKNRAESSIHRGVRVALSLKETELPGICGMIGDLLTVPKGYETAFEVALGGSIQDIITRDSETAKKAISILKDQKAGRATFLPMDLIQAPPRIDKPQVRGCLGVALDLVEYDPKYYEIMNFLLGRILIFQDLDSAVEYSKRSRNFSRIVTIDGDIVRASGALTGGFDNQKGSGLLSRKRELEEIEEKLNDAVAKEKRLTSLINAQKQEKNLIALSIREREDSLVRKRQSLEFFQKNFGKLANETQEKETELKLLLNDLDESQAELTRLESEVINTQADLQKLEAQNHELSEKLKALSGREENIQTRIAALKGLLSEEKLRKAQVEERKKALKKEIDSALRRKRESEERKERAESEVARLSELIEKTQQNLDHILKEITTLEKTRETAESEFLKRQEKFRLTSREMESLDHTYASRTKMEDSLKNKLVELDIKATEIKTHIQNKEGILINEYGFNLNEANLSVRKHESRESILENITNLRAQKEALEPVNLLAIEDYEKTKERYDFMNNQIKDMTEAAASLEQVITEIEKISSEKFLTTFNQIDNAFGEIFKILFPGGSGHLKLTNPENPLESGIDIVCQLPGKKLTTLELFSGGEKSLISIALLFAILQVKPPAFCILDEVEAALDEVNVRRFTRMLRSFADKTQFLVITHNKETMQAVDTIYGITLEKNGISRPISIRLEDQDKIREFTVKR